MKVNHFADKTREEIRAIFGYRVKTRHTHPTEALPYMPQPFPYSKEQVDKIAQTLPDTWDWRQYGAVTNVKDQAICGSCWSFGTTGTVEGAYFLKYNYLHSFSEQMLMDRSYGEGK